MPPPFSPDVPVLPDVFLPYQQRFMRDCFACDVTVDEKSRRLGFSWAAAAVANLGSAAAAAAGGMDTFYIGYNLEMAREFIGYVAEWATKLAPAASAVAEFMFSDPEHPDKEIRAFRIDFASGFKVVALPSMPRALRGMQGRVVIDEAAFHENLPELLKAAFALLIWGGRVHVISTHNGDQNPFNTLVQDVRAGRLPYRLGRTTFDEALAQGLYRRICLTSGKPWSPEAEAAWRAEIFAVYGDGADEELNVIPSPTTGAYLPGSLLDARVADGVPVVRWAAPAGFALWAEHLRLATVRDFCEAELLPVLAGLDASELHVLGEDFGRIRDLSVQWVLAIGADLRRRTRLVLELRDMPFEQQRQVLFYVCDRLPRFFAAKLDAGGNGAYLAEVALQRYGARVEGVRFTEDWYRQNMPPLKAAFEDGVMTLPRDRDVIEDLRMVQIVRGVARVPDKRRDDAGGKRHGDAAIAAVLAYAASRSEPVEYSYEPVRGAPADMAGIATGGWPIERELMDEARAAAGGGIRELRGAA